VDRAADLRELRDTLTEMRRAAVRQAIKLDAPVEKYAAVAELQAHIVAVDAALADEPALAAARPRNGHRGIFSQRHRFPSFAHRRPLTGAAGEGQGEAQGEAVRQQGIGSHDRRKSRGVGPRPSDH
jgi:hypothetical protein